MMAKTVAGAMQEYPRAWAARRHGREPERLPSKDGSYTPLVIEHPLPSTHPLYDTAQDLRRMRLEQERRRRSL